MTQETPVGVADLAGVLAEVARLEVLAAVLDRRLDSSLTSPADDVPTPGHGDGQVIDLRQGANA